jgi:hypothetical protein
MEAKFTRLTHKIATQLHLVAESCTICSSHSRRAVRKLCIYPRNLDQMPVCKTALCTPVIRSSVRYKSLPDTSTSTLMSFKHRLKISVILQTSVKVLRRRELSPTSNSKLKDHPLSAVRYWLLSTFAASLRIRRPYPPSDRGCAMPLTS